MTEDVLACYLPLIQASECISGEMWRIAPSKSLPKIPQALFAKTTVSSDDIPDDPDVKSPDKSRIELHYFLLTDEILICTFAPSRCSAFANYLNSLLKSYRGDCVYKFEPLILLPTDIKLSDISSITFSDRLLCGNGSQRRSKFGIFNIVGSNLRALFDDFKKTNELIDERIMSATMTLKLRKPRKMSEDAYLRKLSALIKPLGADDVDGVSFKLVNGQEIKAMRIHAKNRYTFSEDNESQKENVQNAYLVMKGFLEKLRPL